jgi:hypothetical protein
MKSFILFSCLCILYSCGTRPTGKQAEPSGSQSPMVMRQEVELCREFVSEILQKSVYDDGLQFRFVEDHQSALAFLEKFDPHKLITDQRNVEVEHVRQSCQLRSGPIAKCEYSLPVYDYFSGLLYGIKHYSWPKSTKLAAKKQLINYSKFIASRPHSLMDLMQTAVLVKRMAEENSVYRQHRHQLRTLVKELDRAQEKQSEDFRRRNTSGITCQDMQAWLSAEAEAFSRYSREFNNILNRL